MTTWLVGCRESEPWRGSDLRELQRPAVPKSESLLSHTVVKCLVMRRLSIIVRFLCVGLLAFAPLATINGDEFELLLEECHRQYEQDNLAAAASIAAKLSAVADANDPIQICWAFGWKSRIELKQGDIQQAAQHHHDLMVRLKAEVNDFQQKRQTLAQDWLAGTASPFWIVMPLVEALEGEIAIAAAKEQIGARAAARAAKRHDRAARANEALQAESRRAEDRFREAIAIEEIVKTPPPRWLTVLCPHCGFENRVQDEPPQLPQAVFPCNRCGRGMIFNRPPRPPAAAKPAENKRGELVAECYEGLGEAHELRAENVVAIAYYRKAVDLYQGIEKRWGRARQLERRIEQLEKSLAEDAERPAGN